MQHGLRNPFVERSKKGTSLETKRPCISPNEARIFWKSSTSRKFLSRWLSKPLDVGVNKFLKSFYRQKYAFWRKQDFDITKKGYLKSPPRHNVIDGFVGNSWSKVTAACISNSFRKSLEMVDPIERIGSDQQLLDIVEPEILIELRIDFFDDLIQVFNVSLFESMYPAVDYSSLPSQ